MPRIIWSRVARSNSMGVSVLRARNVDHALRIWSSSSNAGAHGAVRNGLRLSTASAWSAREVSGT